METVQNDFHPQWHSCTLKENIVIVLTECEKEVTFYFPNEYVKRTCRSYIHGGKEAEIQDVFFWHLIRKASIEPIHFTENSILHFECS